MSDRESPFGPSWDERAPGAPPRPAFSTSLPEHTPLPRPRAALVALALVVVAVLAFAVQIGLAAMRLDELRADLATDLPADLDDYTDDEVDQAVWVLVGVVVGLGTLLTLAQLLSVRTAVVRRRLASRTTFLTAVALYVPVAVLAPAVRQGGRVDDVLTLLDLGCLLVAGVLITRAPVSAWLRQKERTGAQPLVPPRPGDELTPAAAGRRPAHTMRSLDPSEDTLDDTGARGRHLETAPGDSTDVEAPEDRTGDGGTDPADEVRRD